MVPEGMMEASSGWSARGGKLDLRDRCLRAYDSQTARYACIACLKVPRGTRQWLEEGTSHDGDSFAAESTGHELRKSFSKELSKVNCGSVNMAK